MSTKIMPITDLRRQTSDIIQSIQENGDTVYITQHGRPTVVLLDFEQYESMVAQLSENEPLLRRERAAQLLQSWIEDGDEVEQRQTGKALIAGLDENRLSDRSLFPADKEGKSW